MKIEKEKTIDHILYKPWKDSADSYSSIEPAKCYNPLPNYIEEKKYNDDIIEVGGLIEHYNNLTLKTLYTIKFFLEQG